MSRDDIGCAGGPRPMLALACALTLALALGCGLGCGLNEGDEAGFLDDSTSADASDPTSASTSAEGNASDWSASASGDGDPGDGDPGDGDPGDGDPQPELPFSCTLQALGAFAYHDCDGSPTNPTDDPFEALGINCPGTLATVQADATELNSPDDDAWRVATGFGTASGPNYDDRLWAANTRDWLNPDGERVPPNTSTALLILSTGTIDQPNNQGVVTEAPGSQIGQGDNANSDAGGLPSPLSADMGSNGGMGGTPFQGCDGVNDCSDSLHDHWNELGWNDPNDRLWLSMDFTVPAGVTGYVFDFAFLSSEWPQYVNTEYNDLFIAWSTSETYTGNITFVDGAPLTVTSLDQAGAFAFTDADPELDDTGFEGGAATNWFVARGSVSPGESFQLTMFLADMGDEFLSTVVLLDNFRWECEGCVPTQLDDCGLGPQ